MIKCRYEIWCDHPNRFSEVLPWFFRRYSGKGGIRFFFVVFGFRPSGGLRDLATAYVPSGCVKVIMLTKT